MSLALPIVRDDRRRTVNCAPGQTVFSFTAPLFDAQDLAIYVLAANGAAVPYIAARAIATDPATLQATITFTAPPRPTLADPQVTLRLDGARVHARSMDVLRAGVVRAAPLEREHDIIATVLQELRRDSDDILGMVVQILAALQQPALVPGAVTVEAMTVVAPDVLAPLTTPADGLFFILVVNNDVFLPGGAAPAVAVLGQRVSWLLGGTRTLDPADDVVAWYSRALAPPGAIAGHVAMQPLVVGGDGVTFAALDQTPDGAFFQIVVNGKTFAPVGATPAYTRAGKIVTWSHAAPFGIDPADEVTAIYTW